MKYTRITLAIAASLLISTPAFGQATRTWVSGTGSDANPCSRTAPCQTFSGALSKTATGGEINALDAGGFGTINITKSITIDGLGPMSSILAANTTGVIINGAGIVVNLRNLTINGANTTTGNGIRILNAARVNIENVVIENFGGSGTNGRGITIETAADVRVSVSNSELTNNFNIGIHSNPTAGTVTLLVDNTRIDGGDFSSIQLRQLTNATISRSTLTNSRVGAGLTLELTSNNAWVHDSVINNNAFGVFNGSGGTPITRLYGTSITNNGIGLNIQSGQVISLGNNGIRGNGGNEVPSSTITTQ
jgi:hypothetical protein